MNEKRSTRRVTTRSTVEHSARTRHMHDNTQCTTHAHVSCTVVPSRLVFHPRTHFLCAYRMAVLPCAVLLSWQLLVLCPVRWPIPAFPAWCVGSGRFFVTHRRSVTLPSSGEARGAHVGVFSTDFACPPAVRSRVG